MYVVQRIQGNYLCNLFHASSFSFVRSKEYTGILIAGRDASSKIRVSAANHADPITQGIDQCIPNFLTISCRTEPLVKAGARVRGCKTNVNYSQTLGEAQPTPDAFLQPRVMMLSAEL